MLAGITSLNVFTFAFFVITFGELCLSPIGMSIMTKLSTKNLTGNDDGVVVFGECLWAICSRYYWGRDCPKLRKGLQNFEILITYTEGYKQLRIYSLIAGVILIAISPLIKKLMQEVK